MRIDPQNVQEINGDLAKTRKAMIILGCSFAEGRGAFDTPLVDEVHPKRGKHWGDCNYVNLELTPDLAKSLTVKHGIKYPEIFTEHSNNMERSNSFGVKLAERLGYTPVMFARSGGGNKGSIEKLTYVPVDWDLADEKIVLFCPTDMNRIDVDKNSLDGDMCTFNYPRNFYESIWASPHPEDPDLWNAWYDMVADPDRYVLSSYVKSFAQLTQWCKHYGAQLISFAAFGKAVTLEEVKRSLNLSSFDDEFISQLPWDSFVEIDGHDNFFSLAMSQETAYDDVMDDKSNMFEFVNLPEEKITCKWLMPCGHPSARAHAYLADKLYEIIQAKQ